MKQSKAPQSASAGVGDAILHKWSKKVSLSMDLK